MFCIYIYIYTQKALKTIHGCHAVHLYWDRLATPAINLHQGQRGARNQKYCVRERLWLQMKLPSYSPVNLNWTVEFPTREANVRSGCLWLAINTLKHYFFFRRWTSFNWRSWPSQRHPSTLLYPGHRLTNFLSSFDQGPVWCCPPIYIWVFLLVSWLRDSI